ncbi:AraC family transcriptional regulator [Aliikangiella coralliicola]|uniref:AraC family transcriptional regulator n=1 Tax=Aliikangiella coralliicola TaxID=2592383 RepID=A0A545UG29_9GAMM|nr:AraC family transcriptional regulator [Aliikangiella coralliicola]TQV88432.1 AraC family transcriptional regulator [Aliikangiella coralliicola]
MSDSPNRLFNHPDALSSLLLRLQLKAEVYVNGDFCGSWAVDTSGSRRIPFHLVSVGKAWLHMDGVKAQQLYAGDLVIFPRDHQHVLSNSSSRPAVELVNSEQFDETGPITHLICGFFEFENKAVWPLLDSLAPVIALDLNEQSKQPNAQKLIELIVSELERAQPGHYAAVDQLAYLLFIEVLRQQITCGQLNSGLLAALFDSKVSRALASIHNHPEKKWTLETLAGEALMGRSSFAQHFSEKVGMPAMQYLATWRMQTATQLLRETEVSMAEIAERIGYESEAAFRKAYKKVVGKTPGQARRNQ